MSNLQSSGSDIVLEYSSGTSMNLGTMLQRIRLEIHRNAAPDDAVTKMAMISAIRFYSTYAFRFNQKTHTFLTTKDQQIYQTVGEIDATGSGVTEVAEGMPSDFISPIAVYYNSTGDRWLELQQVSIDKMRWLTPTEETVGVSSRYAIFDYDMYLNPIPSSDADTVRLDYVFDVGIPGYYHDGTDWVFTHPFSGKVLDDAWTSPWMSDAEELVRARTKWDLYFNYLDDAENAAKMDAYVGLAFGNLMWKQEAQQSKQRRHSTRV